MNTVQLLCCPYQAQKLPSLRQVGASLFLGWPEEGTLQALWDPGRVVSCVGRRQDFAEKGVFRTGFLKARLREVGVFGGSYNLSNQRRREVRGPFGKYPAVQLSWIYQGNSWKGEKSRLALCLG